MHPSRDDRCQSIRFIIARYPRFVHFSQVEAANHTIPLLIISQFLAAIPACMREFLLRILERGTQSHFPILFFRAGFPLVPDGDDWRILETIGEDFRGEKLQVVKLGGKI